jgi:hypothetical protein
MQGLFKLHSTSAQPHTEHNNWAMTNLGEIQVFLQLQSFGTFQGIPMSGAVPLMLRARSVAINVFNDQDETRSSEQ